MTVACTTRPVYIGVLFGRLSGVKALAAGEETVYALLSPNSQGWELLSWGNNETGELGTGAEKGKYNPSPAVVTLPAGEIQQLVPGNHHVLALIGGKVYGWGNNASNTGSEEESGGARVPDNDLLGEHLVGTKWEPWSGNGLAECGNKTKCFPSPVQLPLSGYSNISSIGAGKADSFIVTSEGAAYAWGNNQFGRLGVSQYPFTAMTAEEGLKEKFAEMIAEPEPIRGSESNGTNHSLENVGAVDGSEQRSVVVLKEGVTAPPPAMSIAWAHEVTDSLTVKWRFKWPNRPGLTAYKLRVCVTGGACKPTKEFFASEAAEISTVVGELIPHTHYDIVLKGYYNNTERNKQLLAQEAP